MIHTHKQTQTNSMKMNKRLLLLMLPVLAACGTKGPKEAVIAGKFTNSPDSNVYISTAGITDTVALDENGGFVYRAKLDKPQLYKLNIARTQTMVYLNPGDSSYMEFDVTSPVDGPVFSADLKNIHQSIFSRRAALHNLMGSVNTLYSLSYDNFNRKLDSIQQVLYSMIDSASIEPKDLAELEKTRTRYVILNVKANYPEYSAYLGGKEFNPDSVDYSFLSEVDPNNAYHLMFDEYSSLVSIITQNQLVKKPGYKELLAKSSGERLPFEFKLIDSMLANPKVRDYLKMNKLINDIEYGEFYELEGVVKSYMDSCQTPAYKQSVGNIFNQKMQLAPGKPAPVFVCKDINGKEYSLEDFRGKLVYIDFWATWCGPCRHELPYLEELQKDFKGKNIVFVSISLDDNKAAWEKMVKEKQMKGVQLYGEDAWKSIPATSYQIKGIPTFFLIDAKGNIIKPNAPRPSSNEIRPLITAELEKI